MTRPFPAAITTADAGSGPARPVAAVRQGGWVLASRLVPQAAGVALLVLGGRFLDPAALGSFVLAFAAIELLRQFVRAGWREAVLLGDPDATPAVTFLSLVGAVVATGIALAAAGALWRWTDLDSSVPRCTLILAATLPPLALSVVWEGVLLRRERTAAAAKPLIAAEAANVAVAFLLLSTGHGILALAWARLARAAVLTLGLGHAARWPLALSTDVSRAAAVLPLSANVTLQSLIGFATSSGTDLVVGLFLGSASVAFWRIGSRVAGALAEAVAETVRVLAWSAFAAEARRGGQAALAERVRGFLDRTTVLVAPLFVGLALVSEPLILLLMGDAWLLAGQVIALRALAALVQVPATVAWPALALVGRSRLLPSLTALVAGSGILLVVLFAPFGLMAVAWSQLAAALVGGLAVLALLERSLSVPARPRSDILLGIAVLAAAVLAARHFGATLPPAAALLAQALAGAAAWLGFLRLRRRKLLADLTRGIRR
jgi:O-antigen/teichoic acid export membrane protein